MAAFREKGVIMNLLSKGVSTFCLAASLGFPVGAGPLVEKATEAEELLRAGKPPDALARLDEAMQMVWDYGPLFVKNAIYVDAVSGYGQFTERSQGSAFRAGEKLVIYVEPAGYGFGQPVAGHFEMGFDVDFRLTNKNGEVLFQQQDAMRIGQSARQPVRELYLKVSLNFPEMEPADYALYLRFRDQNSDKYTGVEMPLTIVE